MAAHPLAPSFDGTFPHRWQAEILPARPLILPTRHFVYPREAEEVERGALEVLIRPGALAYSAKNSSSVTGHCFTTSVNAHPEQQEVSGHNFTASGKIYSEQQEVSGHDFTASGKIYPEQREVSGHDFTASGKIYSEQQEVSGHNFTASGKIYSEQREVSGHDFSRAALAEAQKRALAPEERSSKDSQITEPFLATCALGFHDPIVPSGLWSTPNPDEICAVSGGYAYIIDTTAPERFTMIAYRPVLEIRPLAEHGLLVFAGHHSILAWGANGQAWQSARLSSEGLTITAIQGSILHGLGWDLITDKEAPFALNLKTGKRIIPLTNAV